MSKNNNYLTVVWVFLAVLAVMLLPNLFDSGHGISMLTRICISTVFALSYNMLLGQGGMLSFGHAAYYGFGGFIAAHTMNHVIDHGTPIPLELIPLVGALGGLAFAIPLGWINTRRSGVSFAMISLGIGELVAASSLMFTGFFGGEGGVPTNRVTEVTLLPFSYGPSLEVYYLIAGWMLLAAIAMYYLTKTPLGRMANAVRDNPQRAEFVGYSPKRVQFYQFCLAGFFAGLAGGLFAIDYEILTADTLGAEISGLVLLMAFVGGAKSFYGPVLGAIIVTYLSVELSDITDAWMLYFGLMFVFMVMFAPGGLASIFQLHWQMLREGSLRSGWWKYLLILGGAAMTFVGFASVIEMLYHRSNSYDASDPMSLLGIENVVITQLTPWLIAVGLFVVGLGLLTTGVRVFRQHRDDYVQHEALVEEK